MFRMMLMMKFMKNVRHLSHSTWLKITMIQIVLVLIAVWAMPLAEGKDSPFHSWHNSIYWLITTETTVGYGDISPQTPIGKFLSLFVMILGIGSMASMATGIYSLIAEGRTKEMEGKKSYENLKDHVVIFGNHELETTDIIHQILADESWNKTTIVLVSQQTETNPFYDLGVKFVRGELHSDDSMTRSGVANASRVLIHGKDDSETILTAISVGHVYHGPNIVVAVEDPANTKHVQRIDKDIEVIKPIMPNLLTQELQDPGTIHFVSELLSNKLGNTLYRLDIPSDFPSSMSWSFWELAEFFKEKHDATLVGVVPKGKSEVTINPPKDVKNITPNDGLFLIAKKRPQIKWKGV